MSCKQYLTIIVTILLVSCGSTKTPKTQEASEGISKEADKSDFHANAIEKSNKELKPHTDAIKASNKAIRAHRKTLMDYIVDLEAELSEKGSFFKFIVSLSPIILGLLSIIMGRMTNDKSDTWFGAAMFVSGIAIYSFWSTIGVVGLVIMAGVAISWFVISQENKAEKKRRSEA